MSCLGLRVRLESRECGVAAALVECRGAVDCCCGIERVQELHPLAHPNESCGLGRPEVLEHPGRGDLPALREEVDVRHPCQCRREECTSGLSRQRADPATDQLIESHRRSAACGEVA